MAQDIRKLLKDYPEKQVHLPEGHEARFLVKRDKAFSNASQKKALPWFKMGIAAALLVGTGIFTLLQFGSSETVSTQLSSEVPEKTTLVNKQMTLADVSPDLQKIENFYLTGINVQLASLEFSDDNKELVDGYMQRLSDLDEAYQQLNKELADMGPNEATINALIDNLKLRLELLFKLKNKLEELKNQNNEIFNSIQS